MLAAAIAGCTGLRDFLSPPAPAVTGEWAVLLNEIRGFERRIGFEDTHNFSGLSREQHSFPVCGYTSNLTLPYSYEDPAIEWREVGTEAECRTHAREADIYFHAVEAWGESATPVTPAMIEGKIDRFLYLVIHEDCHDQFNLPYGIEEALCDVITHQAMIAFSEEKYGSYARTHRAVQRYAETQARLAHTTIVWYEQLATLYARFERREIPADAMLRERDALFERAEKRLQWNQGKLNNVGMANHMTYSRHYPFLTRVFDALGRDLARTVEFFRHVDKIKPTDAEIAQQYHITGEKSVALLRAREASVLETIRKALADAGTPLGK